MAGITVLLDMDGVLVDHLGGLWKRLGIVDPYLSIVNHGIDDLNYVAPGLPWEKQFYETEYWSGLSWMPDGLAILHVVEKHFGAENVYLMTSPVPSPNCYHGKAMWVQRELPQYLPRLCQNPHKYKFAHRRLLLVDDYDKNVNKFLGAGGQAILVPRYPNSAHQHAEHAVDYVDLRCKQIAAAGRYSA